MNEVTEELLTPEQAGEKLGLSAQAVRDAMAGGRLPFKQIGKRRFPLASGIKDYQPRPRAGVREVPSLTPWRRRRAERAAQAGSSAQAEQEGSSGSGAGCEEGEEREREQEGANRGAGREGERQSVEATGVQAQEDV